MHEHQNTFNQQEQINLDIKIKQDCIEENSLTDNKKDERQEYHNIKPGSLQYDIKLGWIPRSQITGPIPLSFSNELYDSVIQDKMKHMIYLGYRPATTFQLHQCFYNQGKNYPFYQFHLCKSQFLQRFFRKYYGDYDFISQRNSRMIDSNSALEFDSHYQGGNLDAVYFQQNEYRLLLRVDSNTLGHCNYFNFKVKVNQPGKYIFRIVNMTKTKSLYQRGMKPYVRKINDQSTTSEEFEQTGNNIKFADSPLLEEYKLNTSLKSLKFQFHFEQQNTYYQFCYSIPYTYSELLASIRKERNNPYFHVGKLCHSLSGIQIPLLTITRSERDEIHEKEEPFVVVITGRVHPSEANGSHIVNGFINSLLKQNLQMKFLRQKIIFKIIPMINPDGVIVGNTRTSFSGKDLNRRYSKSSDFVFPEVNGIMDYVGKLKSKYKDKLLFLIDIHGHSSRKNSFFYGPEFSIIEEEYTKCRLLPRYYAQRTDVFRYYSCKFKVASFKESTARGYFNSLSLRTYTHETSTHCFFDFATRKDQPFTRKSLQKLGQNLAFSIYDYINLIIKHRGAGRSIKQQILNIKQPIETKKRVAVEQSDESDKLSSSKQDSEDQKQDLSDKKLTQFYSKVNANRQYFYEELVALQDGGLLQQSKTYKQQKKRKKSQSFSKDQPKIDMRRQKLEEELVVKKSIQKVDWVSKVTYPQKKKQFLQYPKLSSVIFGSTIPESYFLDKSTEFTRYQSQKVSEGENKINFNSTKYSIKCIDAHFSTTLAKFSSQPKPFKSLKSIKRQVSQKMQTVLQKAAKQKDRTSTQARQVQKNKLQKYLQLKGDIKTQQYIRRPSIQQMERLLSRPSEFQTVKPIPVCAVNLGETSLAKRTEQKQIMRLTNSLKVLTRKKSIKNMKESGNVIARKVSKSLKLNNLTKKLPSLHALVNNI